MTQYDNDNTVMNDSDDPRRPNCLLPYVGAKFECHMWSGAATQERYRGPYIPVMCERITDSEDAI